MQYTSLLDSRNGIAHDELNPHQDVTLQTDLPGCAVTSMNLATFEICKLPDTDQPDYLLIVLKDPCVHIETVHRWQNSVIHPIARISLCGRQLERFYPMTVKLHCCKVPTLRMSILRPDHSAYQLGPHHWNCTWVFTLKDVAPILMCC